MEILTCNNWQDLLLKIAEAKRILGDPGIVWYRGHSNSENHLYPSLFRTRNGYKQERAVLNRFRQVSSRINATATDDWELLFSMQHYGIPTRLLDWSEDIGTPLFFATKYNSLSEGNINAALFVLNPIKLNSYSGIDTIPQFPNDNKYKRTFQEWVFDGVPSRITNGVAVSPQYNHNRLFAQKGVFTVHPSISEQGNKKDILEKLCPDCLVKIVITSSAIIEINTILELMGINEITVFPDIQGASEYFKKLLRKD